MTGFDTTAPITLLRSGASPFVRKVLICAHDLGLADRIEILERDANPVTRDDRIRALNPLGKVPAAQAPDGTLLYDSRVICEWLAHEAGDTRLFPPPGSARWAALGLQALADGLLDAALLVRYEEILRPEALRWPLWQEKQGEKITQSLDALEAAPPAPDHVDIGTISLGAALGWLDLRRPDLAWRATRPRLATWAERDAQRPAMVATRP